MRQEVSVFGDFLGGSFAFLVQFLGGLGAVLWAKITAKSQQVRG